MVRIPEAIIVDSNGGGRVIAYITEVNDAFGHQVFCYDASGACIHNFSCKAMAEKGWKSSMDVARWLNEALGLG